MDVTTSLTAILIFIFGTIEFIVNYLLSNWKFFAFLIFLYVILNIKKQINDLELKIKNFNFTDEPIENFDKLKKILLEEKQYSLTRIYDEKNNSIGHEWMQVIDDGHWVTMVFDEKIGKFTKVKHYRTDENHKKYQNKDDIVREEIIFNSEEVFGFKDKNILSKEGGFWRFN